jgi:potassium-transporting ATPase KdpC subunit
MKAWAGEIKRAVLAVILLSILLCVIYPLAVWGIGQLFFSEKANGSMLVREKEIVGSILIAQQFTSPVYFHSRPSAVAFASSGANSGGSNLGPLSNSLNEQVTTRIKNYRQENGLADAFPIAADAVSASASGLDPHISPANAYSQAARVARARGLSQDQVLSMIRLHLEERQLGIFGEKRVNVLLLNLALDGHE